jgi:hypothetical protein
MITGVGADQCGRFCFNRASLSRRRIELVDAGEMAASSRRGLAGIVCQRKKWWSPPHRRVFPCRGLICWGKQHGTMRKTKHRGLAGVKVKKVS